MYHQLPWLGWTVYRYVNAHHSMFLDCQPIAGFACFRLFIAVLPTRETNTGRLFQDDSPRCSQAGATVKGFIIN